MRIMITGAAGFLGRRLTRALLDRGHLTGPSGRPEPVTDLVLADLAPVPAPDLPPGVRVTILRGDLADPQALAALCACPVDTIFHLAAQLTFHAEQDPERAWQVNVAPLRALVAAAQGCPRVIFASSIAVFGGPLPEEVRDDIAPRPATTYGTHKAINELCLADATRHGRIDGRALRLPIVLVRPGAPQPVVSDRVAGLLRDPLEGRDLAAPLPPDTALPIVSAGAVTRGLIALQEAPRASLPPGGVLNLPALTVTVARMIEAGLRAGARGRVTHAPDPAMQAVVASWPRRFGSDHAAALGIAADADIDAIVADYLQHRTI